MTATLEQPTVDSAADQLNRCSVWIDDHGCHDAVRGIFIGRLTLPPLIYFTTLDNMRRLFTGKSATKTRDYIQWIYRLESDGIAFEACEWIEESPAIEPQDVTL